MIALNLIGTITRRCPSCSQITNCVLFKYQNKQSLLCEVCLYKKFGIGKITNKVAVRPTVEWCTVCEKLSMREIPNSGFINNSFVVKKFLCAKCGKKAVRRIRKWKK